MTMTFLMVMFFINNSVGTVGAGIATFTYWIIGALVFFVPCIIATNQLGTMFPNEGSLYNWTQKALGSFWSFFAGVSFWVAGILGMVSSAGIAVTFLQGLNSTWLAESRLQGVLIVLILIFSSILSMQQFRVLQTLVNMTMVLMLCVIALLGLAALVWLVLGHPMATSFTHASDLAIRPGNYVLFSIVIFAYLGVNVPMTMGGEIIGLQVVSRHLFRGGLLVLVSYMVVTIALLVVQGPHAAIQGPFSIISTIDQVFGKFAGSITCACVVAFFIVFTALLNSIFGRLLLVGAIDRRLPLWLGELDENRVPLNAIMFQTTIAVLFAALVFLLPYLISIGNPANLANELFTVSLYAHSMIWAISSLFLFINLLVLYLRDRQGFHARRIFPMPVLWACIIVAPLACVLAIVVTLSNSPIAQLIPTSAWGYVVGGLTLIWLIFAAITSTLASSEAAWEDQSNEMG
ncbi:MAG: glutamate/gamma-aminobutyrate family transporter YjeM [Ktedonobacteraceae bacterium]